nr:peptide chain release factor N(5)-glutamine methyltransferase [uncultured Shimia sp.]
MILRDVLCEGIGLLRDANIVGPERDARALLAHALGISPSRISIEPDMQVPEEKLVVFHEFIARRASREPVSKILGMREFWGRDFLVTPDVLDPRPETETLIAAILEGPKPDRILDLGTGSGILAVTVLAENPACTGVACDISPKALKVATQNAHTHGVASRLEILQSDWFSEITGAYDLILSNPPYISQTEMAELSQEVHDHDPHVALSPGGDGLGPYPILANGAMQHLNSGGRIFVEIGWRQGPAVRDIFQRAGLRDVTVLQDMDGRDRAVMGRKP